MGWHISIPVYALFFAEYLEFKNTDSCSPKEMKNEYLQLCGFPIEALSNFDERSAYQIMAASIILLLRVIPITNRFDNLQHCHQALHFGTVQDRS